MAKKVWKGALRHVPLAELKDDVLIGFASEDAWFDYRLENDPRFLKRIAGARKSGAAGKGVDLEDVD